MGIEKLTFDVHETTINSEFLRFDETTLSSYIQTEAGYIDNFGGSLALAEKNLQNKEMYHERIYSERFIEAKENGSTEKLAEAKSKADPDVLSAKKDVIDARYIVNRLKNHLKAWDKSHDNAQSMGHMQRKLIDKLHGDVMGPSAFQQFQYRGFEAVDRIVEPFPEKADPLEAGFETDLSLDNLF